MEEMVQTTCSKPGGLERKIRPQKEQALNCPRCNSTNTKFCYYNNYSLSQPRYFCKTCRRYWTEGGSLRNIPVGGGSRRNKRSSAASSSSNTTTSSSTSSVSSKNNNLPDLIIPSSISQPSCRQNPKIPDGQDLNLGFSAATPPPPPPHHDFKTISELIQVPNFDSSSNSNKDMSMSLSCMPCSSSTTSPHHHLSALELIGIAPRGGLNSFLQMPIPSDINPGSTVFSSGLIPLPDFKPTLNFSLDGLGISSNSSYGGVQETSGRLLFPFEDLKQPSNSTSNDDAEQQQQQQNRDHSAAGYWNGVLGGNGGGGGSW